MRTEGWICEHLGAITEKYNEQLLHSLYGNDIFPDMTEADDKGKESNAANVQEDDVAEEVQGDDEDTANGNKDDEAENVHNDDKDAANHEEEDETKAVHDDEEDAANGATNEDDMLSENMQGNEAEGIKFVPNMDMLKKHLQGINCIPTHS